MTDVRKKENGEQVAFLNPVYDHQFPYYLPVVDLLVLHQFLLVVTTALGSNELFLDTVIPFVLVCLRLSFLQR